MISRLLGWLFPPVLPGRVRDWEERIAPEYHEQGWCGKVQRKYRDGIDRHFAEQDLSLGTPAWKTESFTTFMARHSLQLRHATEEIANLEKRLSQDGYINTIHDCWEKEEK